MKAAAGFSFTDRSRETNAWRSPCSWLERINCSGSAAAPGPSGRSSTSKLRTSDGSPPMTWLLAWSGADWQWSTRSRACVQLSDPAEAGGLNGPFFDQRSLQRFEVLVETVAVEVRSPGKEPLLERRHELGAHSRIVVHVTRDGQPRTVPILETRRERIPVLRSRGQGGVPLVEIPAGRRLVAQSVTIPLFQDERPSRGEELTDPIGSLPQVRQMVHR